MLLSSRSSSFRFSRHLWGAGAPGRGLLACLTLAVAGQLTPAAVAFQIDKGVNGSGVPKAGLGGDPVREGQPLGGSPGGSSGGPMAPAGQVSPGVPESGPNLPSGAGGTCEAGPIVGAPGVAVPAPITAAPAPVQATPTTAFGVPLTGSSWAGWWEQMRWSLGVYGRAAEDGARTGSSDFFLGDGQKEQLRNSAGQLDLTALREEWLPALIELLEREGRYTLRRELIPSLGRLLPHATPEQAEHIVSLLLEEVEVGSPELRDLAILALGFGADERVATRLAGWAEGRPAEVADATRTRAVAALSLGFVARRSERIDVRCYAVHHLSRLYDDADRRRPDIAVCAALGLALVPLDPLEMRDPAGLPEPAAASRSAQARFLLERLQDRREEPSIRAALPLALAQLTSELPDDAQDSLGAVLADSAVNLLEDERNLRPEVARGVAKLLGECEGLGESSTAERVREALLDLVDEPDQATRNLALLAVGQVLGQRRGPAPAGFGELSEALLRHLSRGKAPQRPYAALALGLAAREIASSGSGAAPDVWRSALAEALRRAASPAESGAVCLACGLSGESALGIRVLESFEDLPIGTGERHPAAWAVGVLGPTGGRESLREWAEQRRRFPLSMAAASLALRADGDTQWVTTLWDQAGAYNRDISEALASLRGLTESRDQRSWPLLVQLATEESAPQLIRAEAVRTAGWLAVGEGAPQLGLLSEWVAGTGWTLPEALSFSLALLP
jgi:hypothetical protein